MIRLDYFTTSRISPRQTIRYLRSTHYSPVARFPNWKNGSSPAARTSQIFGQPTQPLSVDDVLVYLPARSDLPDQDLLSTVLGFRCSSSSFFSVSTATSFAFASTSTVIFSLRQHSGRSFKSMKS
jgi:hypothetical protein